MNPPYARSLRLGLALLALVSLAACATDRPPPRGGFRGRAEDVGGPPGREGRGLDPGPGAGLFISPSGKPFRAKPGEPYPVAAWFAAADRDGDGRVTLAEFEADADAFFRELDRNHDGRINDGSELFGSSTPLTGGGNASDGYQALRELDSNSDGVISAADGAFPDLRVWVDAGSDAVSAPGELRTLESLGIVQLDPRAQAGLGIDNGNLLGLTSSYQTADGASHAAADVWFAVDVRDTAPAVALETPADLASRTSLLCQAIGSFDDPPVSAPAGVLSTNGFASAATPSGAPNSLQGAMQQFYTAWGTSVLPDSLAAGSGDLLKSARPPESGFAGLPTDKPS